MAPATQEAPAAPAPAAPAPTTGIPGNSTPSGGMFDKIKLDTTGLTDQESPEGQSEADAANPEGGKPALTVAEIKAAGRTFKSTDELSKAYEESSQEGIRLYRERQTLTDELKKREQAIEDFKAQLEEARITPAFQELSDEDLKGLFAVRGVTAVPVSIIDDALLKEACDSLVRFLRETLTQ